MPTDLTENEILSTHHQAICDARIACQKLARAADPLLIFPRGKLYMEIRKCLELAEGSARQMSHFRADARWLRLGILYAQVKQKAQAASVQMRWKWFGDIIPIFDRGIAEYENLRDGKTGRLSNSPILPRNPSAFLIMPDHRIPRPPMPPRNLIN